MNLLDRIAHSIAIDLSQGSEFPATYSAFLSQVENLIPEALDWAAPGYIDLLDEWVDAGHPGSDQPTDIPIIEAIRQQLENYVAAHLDRWDVLYALTGELPATVRQEISEARQGDDREFYFGALRDYFRRKMDDSQS